MARLIILRLLDSYFRHRWLNLLPLVLMIGLAAASFQTADLQYASHGRLYVQKSSLLPSLTQLPSEAFSWQTPTQIAVNELHELIQTEAFARSVIQKTDLEATLSNGPEALQSALDQYRLAITVQQVGDNVIQIDAKSKQPKLAQQFVTATIDGFSLWKLNADQQESAVAQSFFRDVLPGYRDDLQKARDALKDFLVAHPLPLRGERPAQEQLEISQLQSAVDIATKRVENAMEKEESARLAQDQALSSVRQDYLLIDAPALPTKPETSLKDRLTGPAILVAAGLILTIICIVGGALLDRSFRFPIDVRNGLELQVLAMVPDVSRVVQPAVVNEPLRTLSPYPEQKEFEEPPVMQLPHKQRRGRRQLPAISPAGNVLTDLPDGNSVLSDQTNS